MKKYYLHNGTEQQGPFDLDDLKAKGINKDTPIWYDGLPGWTTAEKVDELKELLKTAAPPPFGTKRTTPPPINKQTTQTETKHAITATMKPKEKNKVGGMVLIIVFILVVIVGGLTVVNNMKRNRGGGSYQEKVMTVAEIEKSDPTRFLKADGTYNQSFWGDKIKIKGVVTNNATVANYKDVVVEVTFYSKTKSVMTSERYVIYDFFPAHSQKNFELNVTNYKGTNTLGWEAVSAIPY